MENSDLTPAVKLTAKQERFCNEYLVDLNATAAARRAGYSEKTANQIAFKNLMRSDIQHYIQQRQIQLKNKLEITQEMVLQEYAKIAFMDIRRFYDANGRLLPPHELDDDAAAALASIDVEENFGYDKELDQRVKKGETKKIRLHSKIEALESIGKHLGFFEKDNEQNKPTAIFATKIEIINTGVPLAGSEKEIQN